MLPLLPCFTKNFISRPAGQLRSISLECEFPVVYADGKAVDYNLIQNFFHYLQTLGFVLEKDGSTGEVIAAHRASQVSGRFGTASDEIKLELGYATIEIACTPRGNLWELEQHIHSLITLVSSYFYRYNAFLLGYGVHPRTSPHKKLLSPKGRYHLLARETGHRQIPAQQGSDIHLFTISASEQTHIDVFQEDAIRVVNVLNTLTGLQIALGANAPIWQGTKDENYQAVREFFWDLAWQNIRPNQIGMPAPFRNMTDYVNRILDMRPIMIKRGEMYVGIRDIASLRDYLQSSHSVQSYLMDGSILSVSPHVEDFLLHTGLAWYDARLAPRHGTVEARVFCEQPPGETMVVPALILGIIENLSAAEALTARFPWTAWKELRQDALQHTIQAQIAGQSVRPLLTELLHLAEIGLRQRKLGEEQLLIPLKRRLSKNQTPADRAKYIFQHHGIPGLVRTFSFPVHHENPYPNRGKFRMMKRGTFASISL